MEKNNFTETEKEVLKIKEIEEPTYTKKGILIEHPKYNKVYWLYLVRRCVAFAIDFVIPGLIQFIIWSVVKKGILIAGMATLIYYQMYYFLTMAILNSRTLGLMVVKLRVVHKSGFATTTLNLYVRAFIQSVYALPYIGWGLMFINFIAMLFMRGISLFDLASVTIVITENKYKELKYIEKLEEKEQ